MRTSSPKRDLVFSGLALAALALGVVVAPVHAELITYTTPAGATNPVSGQPVDATATFTTSTDQIVVVLNNLIVNPTDVSQNISDLFFTVSTGQTSGTINQGLSSGTTSPPPRRCLANSIKATTVSRWHQERQNVHSMGSYSVSSTAGRADSNV